VQVDAERAQCRGKIRFGDVIRRQAEQPDALRGGPRVETDLQIQSARPASVLRVPAHRAGLNAERTPEHTNTTAAAMLQPLPVPIVPAPFADLGSPQFVLVIYLWRHEYESEPSVYPAGGLENNTKLPSRLIFPEKSA